ncbi:MAG: SDR family NAD(P)-dependent oxidoreductase [Xanthomonadales bacterium]|nr:SDR family NAD(P)-dependent oxidoreductase [Gammaproteobacteria bacterium]NNL95471.1 SDR family NAD(P)-dependent oxidoreductase [Xanthomonadales bacterium]
MSKQSPQSPCAAAVITGAGSGLGRAMALQFSKAGYRVAVTDSVQARADSVAREIVAAGGEAFAQHLDVCSEAHWDALYQRVLTEWGCVDVLVNNAGVAGGGRLEDTPLEDWQWIMDTNLMGVVRGCHRFLPMMREQARGHIVNVSSFAGLVPVPLLAAYGTAKAGVVALSEQLRVDLDGSGVNVTLLCPAFVKTRLLDDYRAPDLHTRLMAEKLMNRSSVTPDDVALSVIKALDRKRFLVLTHRPTHWALRMRRWFPNRFHGTMVAMARRAKRKFRQ